MKMKDQLDSPQPMKKPKAKSKKAEVKKKKQAKLKAKKAEKDKKVLKKEALAVTKKSKKSAKVEANDNKDKSIDIKSPEAEVTSIPTTESSPLENTVSKAKNTQTTVAIDDLEINLAETESLTHHNSAATVTSVESKPVQRITRRPRSTRRKTAVEDIQALAENANRQRASKNLATLTQDEQKIATQDVVKRLLMGDLSQGEALRELRVKVLGLRQEAYTELTGVSRKTLSEVENGKGNYTAEILNKMFKPFQLKVSLVPESSDDLKALLSQK
ncbi:helix-turn-helix transcriptional regulator [Marinomonas posidonica]|uniref:helix-turn-helix transcriptional regulator n=1 Tax=Marinomonas posidonica TaxID=936476 RepID=UPI0037351578